MLHLTIILPTILPHRATAPASPRRQPNMVLRVFPPCPAFPRVRLATTADLKRIADLSVLGFKDSEIFRFERSRYEEFPQDAVASFANLYRSQLLNPRALVIVAEDWQRPDEASRCFSEDGDADLTDAPAQRVVVGVASWVLPEGSPLTGQFIVPDVGDPEPAPNRDLCQRRLDLFTHTTEVEQKK